MGRRYVLVAAVVVAALGIGGAATYVFTRPEPPPPAGLDPTGSTTTTTSGASPTVPTTVSGDPSEGPDGTWAVDASGESFVGYRVREEIGGVGINEAVGRTTALEGSLVVEGSTVPEVTLEADLTELRSDDSSRDGQLRRRGLQTTEFPTAGFRLTEPIELPGVPEAGEELSVPAVGQLTLHGVTREVEIPLQAVWTGDQIVVAGSTEIAYADYDIQPPTGGSILSIEDPGILEFRLIFRRA